MISRLKSETNWAGVFVAAVGVIETNAPMLQELLGEWYGLTYVGIGVLMVVLREFCTKPVGEL